MSTSNTQHCLHLTKNIVLQKTLSYKTSTSERKMCSYSDHRKLLRVKSCAHSSNVYYWICFIMIKFLKSSCLSICAHLTDHVKPQSPWKIITSRCVLSQDGVQNNYVITSATVIHCILMYYLPRLVLHTTIILAAHQCP